jgi:uncharacterized protein DUF3943
MKRSLTLLTLAAIPAFAACGATSGPRGGANPFAIVYAEYAVPVALGTALPGQVGGWDQGVSLKRWVQGWTHKPSTGDSDRTFVNFGLHPLSGSETHLMVRSRGWTLGEAFLFDAAASVSWEYVFENLYEPPSRTDLMVTAPLGALLGELRWQAREAGILPWLVDPLGGHGTPFFELGTEGFLLGLQRKF